MARQKRKGSLPPFVENGRQMVTKVAVHATVFLLVVVVAAMLVQAFLYGSDYFKLAVVETKDTPLDNASIAYINQQVLRSYKGRNIFTIDLGAISGMLAGRFPDAKEVTVRIAPPDRLVVTMKFRWPVALVKGTRPYPVDDDGIILANANEKLFKTLPVIEGIEMRPAERAAASGASRRNLRSALELVRELKRSRIASDYGVATVNAADAKTMSFVMSNGVTVKIGCEDLAKRLRSLRRTLKDPRLVLERID